MPILHRSRVIARPAIQTEIPLILNFIQKKAAFDAAMGSFSGTLCATEELLRETLFGDVPFATILLAEVDNHIVGFASYYFRYSSFKAQPSVWLDDLYVNDAMRNQGIGTVLMKKLAEIANAKNCSHLAWTAWKDNIQAIRFYQQMGGELIEEKDKLLFFQLDRTAIAHLLQPTLHP
ncbi:MAG: GNAT family N-acetyltransferase [Leptolyngbyaceae cyanobacterium CRU_2_3]|nr:GNAT family N-acetyltransferase [Leptolyngbyaceae cyanobacterium CRU_2_3]